MTYTTIEGVVHDLSGLSEEELAYFDRCVAAYRAGVAWPTFMDLVRGMENPLLRPTGGVITQAVYAHPLYRALRDMEDRLGIQQGFLKWDAPLVDPLQDEWVPVSQAAKQKGVSVQAIHLAIGRGELVARGTTRKEVSLHSLQRWTPNATRQRSGRMAHDPEAPKS